MSDQSVAIIRRWFQEVWKGGRLEFVQELMALNTVAGGEAGPEAVMRGAEQRRVLLKRFLGLLPSGNTTVLFLLLSLLASLFTPSPARCQEHREGLSIPTTIDDLLAEVGRKVPAFGGMFLDEDAGSIYVYLVPGLSGDTTSLDEAITEAFGNARPPQRHVEVLPGQYTFQQLKTWHDRMSSLVMGIPGTTFTDIDEAKNRLEVAIESQATEPAVAAVLAALNIPRGAVNIHEPERARAIQAPFEDNAALPEFADVRQEKTLRDRFRPLVGGLQIQIAVTGLATSSKCTLGFLATRDKVPGLVTNDHCLREHNQLHLDLNVFYQPTIGSDNRVATGSVAPEPFKPDQNKDCPPTASFCRFSDSAFAKLDGNVAAPVGFIAKPASGSDWDGMAKFRIVGLIRPMQDMTVTRVSSQSGIDTGKVVSPCRNLNKVDERGRRSSEVLICQVVVSWNVKVVPGDSGSPVFTTNRDNDDVMLLGLLWGDTGVSPIEQIKITGTELGPDLLVCAEGFKC